MPYIIKPNSLSRLVYLLDTARKKYQQVSGDGGTPAFSVGVYNRIVAILPSMVTLVKNINKAHAEQTQTTKTKWDVLNLLKLTISHFIQTFNNAIARGVFKAEERPYYGLDANNGSVPVFYKEEEIITWGAKIIAGETERIAKGLTPVTLPSSTDIQNLMTQYTSFDTDQSRKKDKYDDALESVDALKPQLLALVDDLYDEVQFTFRKESAPSKRRNCREYGLLYVTRPGEQPEGDEDLPAEPPANNADEDVLL